MSPRQRTFAARAEPRDAEQDALEALDAGDLEGALTVLMERYGTAVYRFCRQLVADAEIAEEVHQMTFFEAFKSLRRFSRRSTLRTWLFSIARHRCLDAVKASGRRRARIRAVPELPERASGESGAEERLVNRVRRRALEECLGELRAKVRAAVLLRFQQDLSYPEMAEVVGERPATLQARVARAMPALRRCLELRGEAAG